MDSSSQENGYPPSAIGEKQHFGFLKEAGYFGKSSFLQKSLVPP
jgi:hypothetical protein